MRARRHLLAFDRLDSRVVLDAAAGAISTGNVAGFVAPPEIPMSYQIIPDPGLTDGDGDTGTGGTTIPDPGLTG